MNLWLATLNHIIDYVVCKIRLSSYASSRVLGTLLKFRFTQKEGGLQEKLDAERSKRKLADLTEALRQQREIDAQIERARAMGQDPTAQSSTGDDTQQRARLELDKRAQEGEVLQLSFEKPGEGREDMKQGQDNARAQGDRVGVFQGSNSAHSNGSTAVKDRNGDGAAEQQQKRPEVFPPGPEKKKSKVQQQHSFPAHYNSVTWKYFIDTCQTAHVWELYVE